MHDAPPNDYGTHFPNSRKVFVEGTRGVRVPMREIVLAGGRAAAACPGHERPAAGRRQTRTSAASCRVDTGA